MQCPSCGFENMPGVRQCPVCSTSLEAKGKTESLLPPRAKDRTLRQRLSWGLGGSPEPSGMSRWLAGLRAMTVPRSQFSPWAWLTPRSFAMIMLSAIPGLGHIYLLNKKRVGRFMLLGSLAAVAVAAVLIRTPICDLLLYCVLSCSMFSMFAATDRLRGGSKHPDERLRAWVGIGLLVVCFYLGSYVTLRVALDPVLGFVQVLEGVQTQVVRPGDSLLLLRRGTFGRGDVVVATSQGAPIVGPIIAASGDHLVIGDRIYVNGRPVSPGPQAMGEAVGQGAHYMDGQPYSPGQSAGRTLARGEYWVAPNFNYVPDAQAELAAGTIHSDNIIGRVVAITGPPSQRRIFAGNGR